MSNTTAAIPHTGKRTGIDFSKHEVLITQNEFVNIWHLKKPNTRHDSIQFINTNGIMAVTGDYGNWIFCREFHPDAKTGVSEGYWKEKLHISSCQKPEDYHEEKTRNRIAEMLLEDISDLDKTFLTDLLMYTENEIEYQYHAFLHLETHLDSESIPYVTETKYWLLAVFDGFDEICERYRLEQIKQ